MWITGGVNPMGPGAARTGAGIPASDVPPSVRPGADVQGAHNNPTHVSNQYRPGTTFNTASASKEGAQLHGGPPPAFKEGKFPAYAHKATAPIICVRAISDQETAA